MHRRIPKTIDSRDKSPHPNITWSMAKYDYEYRRCGSCNIFITCEPLAGTRTVKVTERRTKLDWAYFVEEIADQNESAEKITLVMDNLNTHIPGSLYEAFPPDKAKALWDRFEFVYTPEGFEKLINRKAYILLLPYYSVYENPHRFCHSRRIFSG